MKWRSVRDMRIDGINRIHEAYRAQSVANKPKVNEITKKDEVALSETAKDFQTILSKLKDVPEVREDKVEAIKKQIQAGTYNVKAEDVADKMLSRLDIRG